jgi:hypothetical protein
MVLELKLCSEESKRGMLAEVSSPAFAFLTKQHFAADWDHQTVPETPPASTQWTMQKEWLDGNIPFLESAFTFYSLQLCWRAPRIGIFPGFIPLPGHAPEAGKSYCTFFLALAHAFSRGTVHISSADPLAAPAIDPCALDNGLDVAILVEAIKYSRRLAATDSLRSVIKREVLPGAEVQSDSELADYVRKTVSTVFHPIGTAAMLPRTEGGVVDASLKVYGTANLRVVSRYFYSLAFTYVRRRVQIDASIIPIHVSAHTQATVYAIAEKVRFHPQVVPWLNGFQGADIIKHAAWMNWSHPCSSR